MKTAWETMGNWNGQRQEARLVSEMKAPTQKDFTLDIFCLFLLQGYISNVIIRINRKI